MQNNIRNTNLRFNLDKEQQRRAWEYLQTMNRQDFKSYSQVIRLYGFYRKAIPEPCSYHHQLGKTGSSCFPATKLRK